jgi:hypothetical protein
MRQIMMMLGLVMMSSYSLAVDLPAERMNAPQSKQLAQQQAAQLTALSESGEAFVNIDRQYRTLPNASLTDERQANLTSNGYAVKTGIPPKAGEPVLVVNQHTHQLGLINGYVWVMPNNLQAAEATLSKLGLSYRYMETINRFVVKTQPSQAIQLKQELSSYPEMGVVSLEIQEGKIKPY